MKGIKQTANQSKPVSGSRPHHPCRMFYQDCVAQLGFEATLMVAYLVLMIAYPTSAQTNSQVGGWEHAVKFPGNFKLRNFA